MAKNTQIILKDIYPKVEEVMKKPSKVREFKKLIERFINKRYESLYDTAPCDRIIFTTNDAEELFKLLGITLKETEELMSKLYYWNLARFNPAAARDEFTILALCVLRYFYLKNDNLNLELSLIYLSFSGKFYPSIHFGSYRYFLPSEYRHVMDYVVNNMLSQKFDLKRYGSVIEAVKSVGLTWVNSYNKRLKSFDDEDIAYIIQQLHNRIKSFMHNIAELYYEAYKNKDTYLTYDSDDLSEDSYRLADSDSLKIERHVEATINNITSKGIDPVICRRSISEYVKYDEVKSILETIIDDTNNIPVIKELIRILVTEYFVNSVDKNIRNIRFITTSLTPKPNTKNPHIIRQNKIIETWLDENSANYRKRKSRLATKLSYHKSVLTYFVLLTHDSAKNVR